MGIYSKDLYSHYLQAIKDTHGDLSDPFNQSQRNKTPNANIDSALRFAALKIRGRLNKFSTVFPPLPEDKRQRRRVIHSFCILFKKLVKGLKSDLKEDENAQHYARNFLWNALHDENLLSNDTGEFLTNILSIYDHPPKTRLRAHTQLLAAQLRVNLTKDKLLLYLRIYGEAYLATILIASFKDRPSAQNDIAEIIADYYASMRNVDLSDDDLKLKRVLEGPVFSAFKLPKLEKACLLREFSATVNGTIMAMRVLTDAALPQMINHLNKKERAKLQFFLLPYWQLASMSNPFLNYDDTIANFHGLITVQTTSGDKYVGLESADKQACAESYVTLLMREITDSMGTAEAYNFVKALALCGASYKDFEKFILELKAGYKVNDVSHHLYKFTSLCDGTQNSIAIKSVQNTPKMLLIAAQLFGKHSAQQQWFRNGVEAANSLSMAAYSREVITKQQCGSRQMQPIESSYVANEQRELRNKIRELLDAITEDVGAMKGIILSILSYCRDYTSITEKTAKLQFRLELIDGAVQEIKKSPENQISSFKNAMLYLNSQLTENHELLIYSMFKRNDVLRHAVAKILEKINKIPDTKQENIPEEVLVHSAPML